MSNKAWLVLLIHLLACVLSGCRDLYPLHSYPFFKVRFEGDVGIIVGAETFVTRDGGRSWKRNDFGVGLTNEKGLNPYKDQIRLLPDGTILHAFGDRLTRIESDGTKTSHLPIPPSTSFQFQFRNSNFGIGVAFYPREPDQLFRTLDAGASWHTTDLVSAQGAMKSAIWLTDEEIYLLTAGQLWHSVDAGRSWQGVSAFGSPMEMKYHNGVLWILNGSELKVYDPSSSSESTVTRLASNVMEVRFRESTVFILGRNGDFYWGDVFGGWAKSNIEVDPTRVEVFSFDFAPDGNAYAVGGQRPSLGPGARVVWTSSDLRNWHRVDFPW